MPNEIEMEFNAEGGTATKYTPLHNLIHHQPQLISGLTTSIIDPPSLTIMSHRTHFPTRPLANPSSVIQGDHYRITILTAGLIRFEYSPSTPPVFEDRASFFALNRDLSPVPKFKVVDKKDSLEVFTDRLTINYDKKSFSSSGLTVSVTKSIGRWDSTWTFGVEPNSVHSGNMRGTTRTLDGVDGRCSLESGIIAREGYAWIDDSDSMLFTEEGWVAPRRNAAPGEEGKKNVDGYLFGYGYDYKEAMKDFLRLSGKQPVISRWAFGNWWSR